MPPPIAGSTISALAPLPIGLAVAVSHLTLGPLTGCGINPARVIGAVVWEGKDWWDGRSGKAFWIYIAGPFAASLPSELNPILDRYVSALEFDGDEAGPYLFHPPQGGPDRPMESASWSQ